VPRRQCTAALVAPTPFGLLRSSCVQMSPCFVLSLLLALVVTLTTASIPLDDPATHGYFPGRSGDVIFRPKVILIQAKMK